MSHIILVPISQIILWKIKNNQGDNVVIQKLIASMA